MYMTYFLATRTTNQLAALLSEAKDTRHLTKDQERDLYRR
jgi:hypothetical protein